MYVKIKEGAHGVLIPGERGVDGEWTDDSIPLHEAFKLHADLRKPNQQEEENPRKCVKALEFQACGLQNVTARRISHILKVCICF
jgi:hypothetical protein